MVFGLLCVHCDLDIRHMTFSQGHGTPWVMGISVWNVIQVQLCSEELCTRNGFSVYVHCDLNLCEMTFVQHQTLRQCMTHPYFMDNNCVKYYPDPTFQWGVMAWTLISGVCALWPWSWRYDLGSWKLSVWYIIQTQVCSVELLPRYGFSVRICIVAWSWRNHHDDIGSRSWHILGSWAISVWNIIHIQLCSEELWPGHGFGICVYCDLDLGVTIHSWVIDNNCVQYYLDRTSEYEVMARTGCEQTDGQTDRGTRWFLYTFTIKGKWKIFDMGRVCKKIPDVEQK